MSPSEEIELQLTTRGDLKKRLDRSRPGLEIHEEKTMLFLLLEDILSRLETAEIELKLRDAQG